MNKERLSYDIISGIYLIITLIFLISFLIGISQFSQTMKSNVASLEKREALNSFLNTIFLSAKYSWILGGIYSVLLVVLIFRFQKGWFEKTIGIVIALLNLRMFAFGPIYYFFDIRKKVI